MHRLSYRLAALAGLGLLLAAVSAPAKAMMIAPSPIHQRVAQADVVVTGKVTAIEEKSVEAEQFPGNPTKAEYRIAVIKIEDHILGAKGLTHVKVGTIVPKDPPPAPGGPGGVRTLPIRRPAGVKFEVGQEVLAFLKQHHDGDFYVAPMYFDVVDKKTAQDFDKQVEQAKKAAKVMADPMAGLKSKDADERLTAAGMLVQHYRSGFHGPNPKTEAIDADESKLIMKTLADADWNPKPVAPGTPINRESYNPLQIFGLMGVTDKDGFVWMPAPGVVQPPNAYQDAAKAWVKEHQDYKIQRFVDEKKDGKERKDK